MAATDTERVERVAATLAARWGAGGGRLEPLTGGLINQTFAVWRGDEPFAVLQQLHPVFGAEVNLDIEALTTHLAARGLRTPRLLRTEDGQPWVEHEGKVWRALTWVEGRSVGRVPDPTWAEAGGELVGRFHLAVADFSHEYRFTRGNVHDTPRYLARLLALLQAPPPELSSARVEEPELWRQVDDLARQILAATPPPLPATARRHCHGDLKISNLLFSAAPAVEGRCLVDLDTIGLGTIAFELGDAMRSWCNPCGEDHVAASFELPVFAAAIRGYRTVADPLLSEAERASIVSGLETVCVELAARFCIDVYEDRYFGWNSARYSSRRAHNLVRAQGQLALAGSVSRSRDAALALACGSLA